MFEQKRLRKYLSTIYTQFVCQFMSISVANKVYRHFWLLVFLMKVKIRECLGPYCEHEVRRFLFNVYKRFLFLARFLRFLSFLF